MEISLLYLKKTIKLVYVCFLRKQHSLKLSALNSAYIAIDYNLTADDNCSCQKIS